MDGRIHWGAISTTAGGVARNLGEALLKLDCPPAFISALGSDLQGKILKESIPPENRTHVKILESHNSAQCIVVFDSNGDCKFLLGDMDIHREISPEMVSFTWIYYCEFLNVLLTLWRIRAVFVFVSAVCSVGAMLCYEYYESYYKNPIKFSICCLIWSRWIFYAGSYFRVTYARVVFIIYSSVGSGAVCFRFSLRTCLYIRFALL